MRRVTMAIAASAAACGPNTAEEGEGQDDELGLDDFGVMPFREDFDARATEMEVQEMIAKCMKAEGRECTPYVAPTVDSGLESSDYDEEEYRKAHGFGVATMPLVLEERLTSEEDNKAADPNFEITQGMSEDELAAYETALYGAPVEEFTDERR